MDETAKRAARNLSESLRDRGIKCSVSVAEPPDGEAELVVYAERQKDMAAIPDRYCAYRVRKEYTGWNDSHAKALRRIFDAAGIDWRCLEFEAQRRAVEQYGKETKGWE